MAEVAKSVTVPKEPMKISSPPRNVSSTNVVKLEKDGTRPTLNDFREFVAASESFSGSQEVEVMAWSDAPAEGNTLRHCRIIVQDINN